jgi:hypothetical protein
MKLPATSVIASDKLRDYVLSPTHPDGRAKAAYMARLGYTQGNWRRLEADIREQILPREAKHVADSIYGRKYEILGPLTGPSAAHSWIRTIWIIPWGQTHARLVTLVPMEEG